MSLSVDTRLPEYADVAGAADTLLGRAVRTPLLESPALNDRLGCRLLVKAEPLQRTGSFKFRGAFNRLSWLDDEQRAAGVVAYSSGNHAQGVAAAASLLGVKATIIMPEDAPALKIENTRNFGAEVRLYDRKNENREAIGENLSQRTGAVLVRPYDDPDIIAGQGTVGLEVCAQAAERDLQLDALLVPAGGGGLIAGCAIACAEDSPNTQVYCAEPEGFDDTARSLAAGRHVENDPDATSICDALLAPTPGELTFTINRVLLAGGLVVNEQEVAAAMRVAFRELKLVVEPGGAVTLAALLSGKYNGDGKTVAVVFSGGNVDPGLFARILAEGD